MTDELRRTGLYRSVGTYLRFFSQQLAKNIEHLSHEIVQIQNHNVGDRKWILTVN